LQGTATSTEDQPRATVGIEADLKHPLVAVAIEGGNSGTGAAAWPRGPAGEVDPSEFRSLSHGITRLALQCLFQLARPPPSVAQELLLKAVDESDRETTKDSRVSAARVAVASAQARMRGLLYAGGRMAAAVAAVLPRHLSEEGVVSVGCGLLGTILPRGAAEEWAVEVEMESASASSSSSS